MLNSVFTVRGKKEKYKQGFLKMGLREMVCIYCHNPDLTRAPSFLVITVPTQFSVSKFAHLPVQFHLSQGQQIFAC
jgi:hypothetical protein